MNETGISIPWWSWLALIAALVACAIVAKIARDIRATKNIIAARTKNTQQVEDEDRKLVRYGKRLGGHSSHGRANGATKRKQPGAAR